LSKSFYYPGQIVHGAIYLDIFNQVETRPLILKIKGKERLGRFFSKIQTKKTGLNDDPFFHTASR
jgi:hypothetical protein